MTALSIFDPQSTAKQWQIKIATTDVGAQRAAGANRNQLAA
jgi:hypothetical protein